MSESRVYKVIGASCNDSCVYRGFNRRFSDSPNYVAIVQTEGDVDVFALDTPTADSLQELVRYLNDQQENYQIIGVYCR